MLSKIISKSIFWIPDIFIPQKLYEDIQGQDEFACFVKCVARLMEVEYLTVKVDSTSKTDKDTLDKLKNSTPMGRFRFPVLEVPTAKDG